MNRIFFFFFFSLAPFLPPSLGAFDVWSHPEAAGKNSLFLDVHAAAVSFKNGFTAGLDSLEFQLDYLPPLPLPFFVGAFLKTPNPNLKSFGPRIGYHFDVLDRKTDLYFFYRFDFGFVRNPRLLEYGDTEQPYYNYDFRFGVRRVFNRYLDLVIESGFKFSGFSFGLSFKFL
jgi:hypothetical protein